MSHRSEMRLPLQSTPPAGSQVHLAMWAETVPPAVVKSGPALYAGGDFTTAGGGSANYLAKWNGASWSAMGSGPAAGVFEPLVNALAVRRRRPGTLRRRGVYPRRGRQRERLARELVRPGFGSGRRPTSSVRADRSSTTTAVRHSTPEGTLARPGGQREPDRQVGRRELVRPGFGNERRQCVCAVRLRRRWGTGTLRRRAILPRPGAAMRTASPGGTAPAGPQWDRE
jgi:hypothetical protein